MNSKKSSPIYPLNLFETYNLLNDDTGEKAYQVYRYMNKVHDPTSRMYCTISAYNAGVSNVDYALIGRKSMRKAIPTINSMESEAVYVKLTEGLPSKENRGYLKKSEIVSRSMRDGSKKSTSFASSRPKGGPLAAE